MSELQKVGRRLDNIKDEINPNPKDNIWIMDSLDLIFKDSIKSDTSKEKENNLIKKLNNLLDTYEFRFNKTFENLNESKLTPRELAIKNKLYNQYKQNKKQFIKDYGKDAEQVMLGRAIKLAKSMALKEQKTKIKETIIKVLKK
jgi:hypothetical protein